MFIEFFETVPEVYVLVTDREGSDRAPLMRDEEAGANAFRSENVLDRVLLFSILYFLLRLMFLF